MKKKYVIFSMFFVIMFFPTKGFVKMPENETSNLKMQKDSCIFVAGGTGLVGRAIVRKLKNLGFSNILTKSSKELDLRDDQKTKKFFFENKIDFVFLSAAKVGGILANSENPATFIYDNIKIQTNIIHNAYLSNVKKLLFLGSSCIYPRNCSQPIKEEYLLSDYLEKTNDAYAIAKICGIKMCQSYNKQYGTNFISCMPTNLYGKYDNFDLKNSHVIPALIKKFCHAKKNNLDEVVIWGTGAPLREFLHVDDLADASVFLMQNYTSSEIVNIGTGKDISIKELAYLIKNITGFEKKLVFDNSKPDGTPKKLLDVSKINNLGWRAKISLKEGLEDTINWYSENSIKK
jgi:GDP-L-fucose synthase